VFQPNGIFLPCAGSGASETYRSALSSFAANGTDLTDAFTGRLARGIRNRLMNEFRHVSSRSQSHSSDGSESLVLHRNLLILLGKHPVP
jgi:NAD(P)H-dependent flavin oxidoreductase YrpB (nitropropane dioxygenase family)